MALSNRQLLMQQRKKEKGLPVKVDTPITAPVKDTSRRTGRVTPSTTGFQGITKRQGLATLKAQPEIVEGMKPLAGLPEFNDTIKGKEIIDVPGEEVSDTGLPANVSIAQQTAKGTASQIARERAAKGFAPVGSQPSSFGLPTDRAPSFAELGGAIGQMFKHVGGIIKKRKALGLIPGRTGTTTAKGLLPKDRATILTKRLEDLTLSEEERVSIKKQLEEIINPEASDISAILNE